ncbi:hypothetical protein SEA_EVEPICKLES_33 [Arthrobacter phage EvePickles]|nr:hypothetical protein SEA_EVEPICKLES_33 [Arthrobacter phage EvePickles]
MDWIWDVAKLVLAAGLGFGGGQAAVELDRRRKKKDELASMKADWEVTHAQGALFHLRNKGNARATQISVVAEGGEIIRDLSPTDLGPDGAAAFFFSRETHAPQLHIRWKDEAGSEQGPVSRLVPPGARTPRGA